MRKFIAAYGALALLAIVCTRLNTQHDAIDPRGTALDQRASIARAEYYARRSHTLQQIRKTGHVPIRMQTHAPSPNANQFHPITAPSAPPP